jgi:beta-glucosidase
MSSSRPRWGRWLALGMLVGGAGVPRTARAQIVPDSLPFRNPALPLAVRVRDLVARLSLEEKAAQLTAEAPAIPRLGIPAYKYWDEANHGVVDPGHATVFPQSIALAATWDPALVGRVASVISDEARAKYRGIVEALPTASGAGAQLMALTFFAPNVNIDRDPRWGRGQETFGEDPFLTSRLGVAFVRGMQGNDPLHLKTVATAKHFAVHSGPEAIRFHFNADASPYDLTDTYLPQFEALVREGGVSAVMSSYNRTNGVPMTANPAFLTHLLREQWGFGGYVVSDCTAVEQLADGHHYAKGHVQASAMALAAGVDMACMGNPAQTVVQAVQQGLLTAAQVDTAVTRVFNVRFRLGMFDPNGQGPYAAILASDVETSAHQALARAAADEAMTLLKNVPVGSRPLLPLALHRGQTIALIGPMAARGAALYGNYSGVPSTDVSLVDGIRRRADSVGVKVTTVEGTDTLGVDIAHLDDAVVAARTADVVVMALGVPWSFGEEFDFSTLDLPAGQELLLERVAATGKPIVLVLVTGHPLTIGWAAAHVPAILLAWYPGEVGGLAVADGLFGDVDPAGRLPVTFYRSVDDLPSYESYDMRHTPGRTYRYFTGAPLYAFGFGLSYTTFRYRGLTLPSAVAVGDSVPVSVEVTNTGSRAGDAVVEVYVSKLPAVHESPGRVSGYPIRALAAFQRASLRAGETRRVVLTLRPGAFSTVTEDGQRVAQPGTFEIAVGGAQPGAGNHYASSAVGTSREIRIHQ